MSNQLTIAYHIANKHIAEDIQKNLNPLGYDFTQVMSADGQTIAPQVRNTSDKVLLVISDNFLKSEESMHDLLEVFQDLIRSERVLPVITEGIYKDDITGIYTKKPTTFDRVSDAIQYMNYWQDEYLEIRRKKRELLNSEESTASKEEVLNNKLGVIRNISSDIGEFFRFLRSKEHVAYDAFRANNFAKFFQFIGHNAPSHFVAAPIEEANLEVPIPEPSPVLEAVETAATNVADTADLVEEAPIEIASIPGIDLLESVAATPTLEEDSLNFLPDTTTENPPIETTAAQSEDELMDALDKMFEEDTTEEQAEEVIETIEATTTEEVEEIAEEAETTIEETITNTTQMEEPTILATPQEPTVKEITEEDKLRQIHTMLSLDDVGGAMQEYFAGLEQFPESVNLRYGYATSLIKYNKDFDAARKQLKTLVNYDSENYNAHFLLGEIAELKEDYADAKLEFERVLELHPEHVEAPYRLANVLSNHFEGSEQQAGAWFEKAIARNPENADAHYQYAVLQDEYFDNPDTALAHYQKTIALDEQHPYAHYDMAVLYHGLEDMENAKIAYEQASIINSEVKTPQNDAAFLGVPLEFDLPPEGIIRDDAIEVIEEGENLIVEEEVLEDVEPLAVEEEEFLEEELVLTEDEPAAIIEEVEEEAPVAIPEVEEVAVLKSDIKRLEDLVLKNQNMLMMAQQNLVSLTEEEEIVPEQPRVDKVVVITGATSGIGRATADVFAAAGYRLILTGRRGERLEDIHTYYQENYGSDVLTRTFDVRELDAVKEMVDSLDESWQNIDLLINNAGLAKGFAPIHEGEIDDWEVMIDTNIKGLLYMTRAVSPHMVARGSGQIINVCSSAGHEVYPNGNVYCATKYAVDALTKSMRLDLHKHNIRVSQVSPGHVEETEFALTRFDGDAERAKIYEDFQPLKASDVAETIFFLATRPAHVNIQDVVLFGTQQASNNVLDRSGRA